MAVKCGWASIDERGRARGGVAGQSIKNGIGTEVKIGNWYYFGQNVVLRFKSRTEAAKAARVCEQLCSNRHVGYDQNQRTTLYDEMKRVKWDPAKIARNCETDCSALIAVILNAIGIKVSKDIWTGNMVKAIMDTGKFSKFTGATYCKKDKYCRYGDIIVNEAGHVIMALEDGEGTKELDKTKSVKTINQVAKEVIDGKWGNGDERKRRLRAAGYDPEKVQLAVNAIAAASKKKSNMTIAKEVINGKWGTGEERKRKLTQAGYNYNDIQKLVNQLVK